MDSDDGQKSLSCEFIYGFLKITTNKDDVYYFRASKIDNIYITKTPTLNLVVINDVKFVVDDENAAKQLIRSLLYDITYK